VWVNVWRYAGWISMYKNVSYQSITAILGLDENQGLTDASKMLTPLDSFKSRIAVYHLDNPDKRAYDYLVFI
jgi:hypothetical protein